jgi:hypothetical protein
MKAKEKFSYTASGPYSIYYEQKDGTLGVLREGIARKKLALTEAKNFLEHGNFPKVLVYDCNKELVYDKEKTFANVFEKDIRFRAFLRLLIVGSKMAANFRYAVIMKMAEEYKERFPVVEGEAWLPEEDEALKILLDLGAPDNNFIADLLGRSESAVSHRILRMGFKSKQVLNRPTLFNP